MAIQAVDYIWMDGELVKWDDAKIHVLSHVVHYGTNVFEGLRAYNYNGKAAILCLREHLKRLYNSAKVYRLDPPYTIEQMEQAVIDTIKANKLKACYIRPIVYRGFKELGVNPFNCPINVTIAVWEWGAYLGEEALEKGVDVKVSTWNRMAPNTFPAMAKCGANYMNSQLIKMEAILEGYVEGIALDVNGYVCEGSGENIFLVLDDVVYTPPLGSSILAGITRENILTILKDWGVPIIERAIPREMLYIADEVFFTGSAAEVTPIRSIDKIKIGEGRRGPLTERLQMEYFNILKGRKPDRFNWLTFVE